MYWASGLHLYTPLPFRPGRDGYGDLFKYPLLMESNNFEILINHEPHIENVHIQNNL